MKKGDFLYEQSAWKETHKVQSIDYVKSVFQIAFPNNTRNVSKDYDQVIMKHWALSR